MFITLLTLAITRLCSLLSDDEALLAEEDDFSELLHTLVSVAFLSIPSGVTGLTILDIPAETSEYGTPAFAASAIIPREKKRNRTREQIVASLTIARDNFLTFFIYLLPV